MRSDSFSGGPWAVFIGMGMLEWGMLTGDATRLTGAILPFHNTVPSMPLQDYER
jgi:hypothetical protein